jgi:Rrf2 family transcriptional regulator, iron-sulfur cluster assembly transcription factor
MITISRETDYACRVILHLAMLPAGHRVTAQEIAKRRIVPRALIRRVVTRLGAAKLVTTTRGSGGGLALARPASEISLQHVVEAMEGQVALNTCVIYPRECPLVKKCPVHEAWARARAALVKELSAATFDKLAQRGDVLGA